MTYTFTNVQEYKDIQATFISAGTEPTVIDGKYQVSNLDELKWITYHPSSWGQEFVLTANVDATGSELWNRGGGFTPIGTNDNPFTGKFLNPDAYTISNLTINLPSQSEVGFFGVLGTAEISGLKFLDISVTGNGNVGALAGKNDEGKIVDCSVEGNSSISGGAYVGGLVGTNFGEISGSSCHATVMSTFIYAGGLIGLNNGDVLESNASGSVLSDSHVGGLVGVNEGKVKKSFSSSLAVGNTVVGGLIGQNRSLVINSYASGDVSGNQEVGGAIGANNDQGTTINTYATGDVTGDVTSADLGGFAGRNVGFVYNCFSNGDVSGGSNVGGFIGYNTDSVLNCYSSGEASALNNAGGFIGFFTFSIGNEGELKRNVYNSTVNAVGIHSGEQPGVTPKTDLEMKEESTFTALGWNFLTTWEIIADGFPTIRKTMLPAPAPANIAGEYQIASLEDLRWVSENPLSWTGNFTIIANIDAFETRSWNCGSGFVPIGTRFSPGVLFTGNFNNAGQFEICDLYIDRPEEETIGLFGAIDQAELDSIILTDIYLNCKGGGALSGWSVESIIRNCSSTGEINSTSLATGGLLGYVRTNSQVINCFSKVKVIGERYVGGLIGTSNNTFVSNCNASGDVSGDYVVGGLVGSYSLGTLEKCFATGNVIVSQGDSPNGVGGLVGISYSSSIVRDCYSTGNVNGSGVDVYGGLVGRQFANASVINCYAVGLVKSGNGGGLIGVNSSSISCSNSYFLDDNSTGVLTGSDLGVSKKTSVELKEQATFTGWNFTSIWRMHGGGYPTLRNRVGLITEPNYIGGRFQISSLDELRWISQNPEFWGADFELTANIDASETVNWNKGKGFLPIGIRNSAPFTGSFSNAGKYAISNLYINRPAESNIALFAATENAEFSDITLNDCYIYGNASLIGWSDKTIIRDCSVSGTIISRESAGGLVQIQRSGGLITDCSANVIVSCEQIAGGLVGQNSSKIDKSYSVGVINGGSSSGGLVGSNSNAQIYRSYSECEVNSSTIGTGVGGLVGSNYSSGVITNCYARGVVSCTGTGFAGGLVGYQYSNSYVINSYSSGAVGSSIGNDGGLIGYHINSDSIDNNNFNLSLNSNGVASGSTSGILGRTEAQLKQMSSFSEWNFGSIWNIKENIDFPHFIWSELYTVTFDLNGGTLIEGDLVQIIPYGDSAIAPVIVAPAGFELSWDVSLDNITLNQTIKAVYTKEPSLIGGVYQISSLDELRWVSEHPSSWDSNFELVADIDASDTVNWYSGKGFSPIGTNKDFFTGDFKNEGGYSISNLTINRPADSYLGLFGFVSGGELNSIHLENVNILGDRDVGALAGYCNADVINCTSSGLIVGDVNIGGLIGQSKKLIDSSSSDVDVSGNERVGGIAGTSTGIVQYTSASGSVSGGVRSGGLVGSGQGLVAYSQSSGDASGTNYLGGLVGSMSGDIENSFSTGKVKGKDYIGGLAGLLDGDSVNCYAKGEVEGENYVGGFAGYLFTYSKIDNSFSIGNVVGVDQYLGGFVGYNYGDITNCYSMGNVNEGSPLISQSSVGGFVGYNDDSIYNCYSTGIANGTTSVGAFIGDNTDKYQVFNNLCITQEADIVGAGSNAGIKLKSEVELKSKATFLNEGWDFLSIWGYNQDQYPFLFWEKANLTSHTYGEVLDNIEQTFEWTDVGADRYTLFFGTSQGGRELFTKYVNSGQSITVDGLPSDGSTVWLRLWSLTGSVWNYNDYEFTSASSPININYVSLTSHSYGEVLDNIEQTFEWTDLGADRYTLFFGTSQGGRELFTKYVNSGQSITVDGLPSDGSTVWLRLWSLTGSVWNYNDYEFTSASSPININYVSLTSHSYGEVLDNIEQTFEWTDLGADRYTLFFGTSQGGRELFTKYVNSGQSITVDGLPSDGSTVWLRLWSLTGNVWNFNDYEFAAVTVISPDRSSSFLPSVSGVILVDTDLGIFTFVIDDDTAGQEYDAQNMIIYLSESDFAEGGLDLLDSILLTIDPEIEIFDYSVYEPAS